jgi:hypothetical protein
VSRRPGTLLTVTLIVALWIPAPVAGAATLMPTFDMRMGDCTVAGEADPGVPFRVIVRSKDGEVLLRKDVAANAQRRWYAGCLDRPVAAGQRIAIRVGDSLVRLFVIQPLTIRADRAADILYGRAPTTGLTTVIVDGCEGAGGACAGTEVVNEAIVVAPDGTWSLPTAPYDLDGGDSIRVIWTEHGDLFYWNQSVPSIVARVGSSSMGGQGPSGTAQRAEVRDAAGILRGTAVAKVQTPYGGWEATVRRNGSAVPVRVDDRIKLVGQDGPSLRVRAFLLLIKPVQERAVGTCFPDREFGLLGFVGSNLAYLAHGLAGPDGAWEVTGIAGIESGWTFRAFCANSEGDLVRVVRTVP